MPTDLDDPVGRPPAWWPGPRGATSSGRSRWPHHRAGSPRRTGRVAVTLATVVVLVCGIGVALDRPAPVVTVAAPAGSAELVLPPAPPPVRATVVDIPALKLHSDLVELGVDAAGVLVPPGSPSVAGWFTGSASPGDPGPTVIAGHVDSRAGPGVFFRLKDLEPGDLVTVGRSDGVVARYRVTDVTVVDKNAFPTERVYGPTPAPELRLITCGGEFDRSARRYLRNVVVSAVLVEGA